MKAGAVIVVLGFIVVVANFGWAGLVAAGLSIGAMLLCVPRV